MKTHFQTAKLDDVMRFFANNFKGDDLMHDVGGDVMCDWWLDQVKGTVVFRLYRETEKD